MLAKNITINAFILFGLVFFSFPLFGYDLHGWNIPERMAATGDGSWMDLDSFNAQIFTMPDRIGGDELIAVAPDFIERKIVFNEREYDFTVIVFGDFLRKSKVLVGYTWVLVIDDSSDHYIYLNGLKKDEIHSFLESWLPRIALKVEKLEKPFSIN